MATSVVYPFSKINLGLHVLEKREDGFHNIETLFVPHSLCDILEITDVEEAEAEGVSLFMYGLPVEGTPQSNLCVKTYHMLSNQFSLGPVQIHLYKNIPPGSGLGGGSSNAAFCLQLLNKHFKLNLTPEQLQGYALQLGSDVPFFMQEGPGKPYLATGKGEILTPYHLDLSSFRIELRFSGLFVSTAQAYAEVVPKKRNLPLPAILKEPIETWKEILENDFEETVFRKYPQIKQSKENLYNEGAVYASMTGSGSAVFGLFK
ncbi:MAG: 4-(cytidine 5'-diphospho)-2-C-methyl-D-erythritol kinase [Bacteroidales bacterium]|nr:4-(cytidine 5'-diphospho)-2-C-methyl-D-erythritol kinase [Bacteroidales bacterium]